MALGLDHASESPFALLKHRLLDRVSKVSDSVSLEQAENLHL